MKKMYPHICFHKIKREKHSAFTRAKRIGMFYLKNQDVHDLIFGNEIQQL